MSSTCSCRVAFRARCGSELREMHRDLICLMEITWALFEDLNTYTRHMPKIVHITTIGGLRTGPTRIRSGSRRSAHRRTRVDPKSHPQAPSKSISCSLPDSESLYGWLSKLCPLFGSLVECGSQYLGDPEGTIVFTTTRMPPVTS